MEKKQVWKKAELSLPGKQPRNCDMSNSASGAVRGKEHMHSYRPGKKVSLMEVRVKVMPWAQLYLLVPKVLLNQSGRSKILCC